MLRIKDAAAGAFAQPAGCRERPGPLRLASCALLGLTLGIGVVTLGAPLVRAGDDAGVRDFIMQEAARRAPQRGGGLFSYAPATTSQPLASVGADGRIAHPPVGRSRNAANPNRQTVSGASSSGRSICVRMCDGYHMPIGNLASQADFTAHEALCAALNPGIPVKLFRVAPGAETIDDATARDGKTYASLPVAYGHEKSGDPACRPPIATAADRRVSLLRDFTLRPGDTVVLDGQARSFRGSSHYPYSARDFADFRSTPELGANDRRRIDALVGISYREAQMRALRHAVRVRDARALPDGIMLRGRLDDHNPNGRTGLVRQIALPRQL